MCVCVCVCVFDVQYGYDDSVVYDMKFLLFSVFLGGGGGGRRGCPCEENCERVLN